MADPLVTFGFIGFFAALSGLLGLTFVAFTRMDRDVRRARMFIMEKRIQRFLGAFTVGFIALTVAIILPSVGVTLPTVAIRGARRVVGSHGVRHLRIVPHRATASSDVVPNPPRFEISLRPEGRYGPDRPVGT